MIEIVFDWATKNWIELTGAVFGLIYVFLSVKQNMLTWVLGLLTSLFYIYIFFASKFYADMALQFYYVWVSIYGWIIWKKGEQSEQGKMPLHVSKLSKQQLIILLPVSLLLWVAIYFVLKLYTDSPVPFGDSFTTAFSIVATWMLARKIIEHWLIWIVVDLISFLLYLYKGLYPTTILFIIYTLVAAWGYWEWKKNARG
jgi:nicotinamide mononucleotide transporter